MKKEEPKQKTFVESKRNVITRGVFSEGQVKPAPLVTKSQVPPPPPSKPRKDK